MKRNYFIILLLMGVSLYGQQTPAFKNTAVLYCKALGYQVIEDSQTKKEFCILPNGVKVNPWDFFHGDVGKEYSYCAKKGYDLRIKEVKKGRSVNRYTICDSKEKGKPSKTLISMLFEDADFASLYEEATRAELPPDTLPIEDSTLLPPPEPDPGYPYTFDWNSYNGHDWDNEPENQGPYGICYAMAASSVAETVWNYQHNSPVGQSGNKNFSQAFIAFYWSFNDSNVPYEWWTMKGTAGLRDGYEGDALEKLCTNGIIEESEFPWNPSNPDTTYTYSSCERYRFTSFGKCPTDKASIKQYIMDYGPLWTTMIMDYDTYLNYYGQVLTGNYVNCGIERDQNHAVVIVGWGYSEAEGEYWIVKNSYGPTWPGSTGNGYMKIATDNAYGINCEAYYLDYNSPMVNGNDLAYDPQSMTNVPSGYRSIQYKPEPYTAFNGFTSANQWATGSVTDLSPKNLDGINAIVKFKVRYGRPYEPYLDPDSVEYYEKTIWAGKPVTPTVTGSVSLTCDNPAWYYGSILSSIGLTTAESFSWNLSSDLEEIVSYDNPPRIQVRRTTGGTHTISLSAVNDLGNKVSQDFHISSVACDSVYAFAYPNPTNNELNISITDNLKVAPEFELELLDSKAIRKKHIKTKEHLIQWNVQELLNGSYTVRIRVLVDGQFIQEKQLSIIVAR